MPRLPIEVIYTWAGPEIAVATTKAYSTQLAVIDLLALHISEQLGTLPQEEHDELLHAAGGAAGCW